MKKRFHSLYIALCGVAATSALTSCNDDDFTSSIFDTTTPAVDTTAATADFDQWLLDNFVTPYNTEIIYRFNLPASSLSYNLTPADYKKSQLLAQLVRHLYYDVYTDLKGEDFMKAYGPRLFHFIGSVGYNAVSGTEVLGTASGGIKITLYNVNALPDVEAIHNGTYEMTSNDILTLNEYYFHTMHHEFSHILHQTKTYPVAYGQVTPSTYDPLKWQERDSVETHLLGYVTNYGSSAEKEDFVENLSCIITDTDYRWMMRIIDGCMSGVRNGDKEEILTFIDSLEVVGIDDASKPWNNFDIYLETDTTENTTRYVPCVKSKISSEPFYDSSKKYERVTHISNFKTDFLNNWVKVSTADDLAGINSILKKISISTTWYTEKWGLYAYTVRREVRKRQDGINEYLRDNLVLFDYKTSNSESK
jgi:substrate import-associated zinc metallohydrolase lipoprotein